MGDETFYGFDDDRKQSRNERKRRAARDRSKFKKSDRKEAPTPPSDGSLIHGRVLAITSEGVTIEVAPDEQRLCTPTRHPQTSQEPRQKPHRRWRLCRRRRQRHRLHRAAPLAPLASRYSLAPQAADHRRQYRSGAHHRFCHYATIEAVSH